MTRTMMATLTASLLLLALSPLASAHPSATTFELAGDRCYLYTNDTEQPEFWIESNGLVNGGVQGSALSHVTGQSGSGSGLQRSATTVNGVVHPADTQVTLDAWLARCVTTL